MKPFAKVVTRNACVSIEPRTEATAKDGRTDPQAQNR